MAKDYEKYCQFAFVCNGSDCKKKGAKDLERAFAQEFKKQDVKDSSRTFKTKCTGRCKEAPVVIVGQQWLPKVKPADVPRLVEKYFRKAK